MKYQEFFRTHLPDLEIDGDRGAAPCPFHPDRGKSFRVNLETGRWECSDGCGGGNHILFCEKKGIGIEGTPEYQYLVGLQSHRGGIPLPDNSGETAQKLKQMMAERFPGFGLMMNPAQPVPSGPTISSPTQDPAWVDAEARRNEIARQLKEKIEEKLPAFAQMMSGMPTPGGGLSALLDPPQAEPEDPAYRGEMMKIEGEAMVKKGKLLIKKGEEMIRSAKKASRSKKKP